MNWFIYLLESNIYLLIFFGCYKLLLEHQTFHQLNRGYLLLTAVTSFLLPLFKISGLNPADSNLNYVYTADADADAVSPAWEFSKVMVIVYIAIAAIPLTRLLNQLNSIRKIAQASTKDRMGSFYVVNLDPPSKPFSFLNFIFLNDKDRRNETILRHEIIHASQHHSLDIILLELLHIISWFNPVFILIKQEIRGLHEFLADEQVAMAGTETAEYAMFLIQHSNVRARQNITNQMFNHSLLKKRILMLSKPKSATVNRLRYSLILVMVPAMVCGSSIAFSKSYGVDLTSKFQAQQDSTVNKKVQKTGKKQVTTPPPPAQHAPPPPPAKAVKTKKQEKVPPPPPPAQPVKRKSEEVLPPPPSPVPPRAKANLTLKEVTKGHRPLPKIELTLTEVKEAKALERSQIVDSPIKQEF